MAIRIESVFDMRGPLCRAPRVPRRQSVVVIPCSTDDLRLSSQATIEIVTQETSDVWLNISVLLPPRKRCPKGAWVVSPGVLEDFCGLGSAGQRRPRHRLAFT